MMLRAEAAPFQPGKVTAALEELVKCERMSSPCSTALPSPDSGMSVDPFRFRSVSEASALSGFWPMSPFLLPEAEDATKASSAESEDLNGFKLEGLQALQASLASFLVKPSSTPQATASEVSPASTPPASACAPPPGLEACLSSPRPRAATSPASTASQGASPASGKGSEAPVVKQGWRTVPRSSCLGRDASEVDSGITTVTVKNVPRKSTRDQVVAQIEEAGFGGKIGLVYLPVDLGKKCGNGQAVVSFHSVEACEQFTKEFHKASAKAIAPLSPAGAKNLEVTPAPLQGLKANIEKLRSSALLMDLLAMTPEWLPRLLDEEGGPVDFFVAGDAERPEH